MKSFCTDTLAKDGWLPCNRFKDKHYLWEHPDFPSAYADANPQNEGGVRFYLRYKIETSQLDNYNWETLEIPDYLLGRVSISDENLSLGEGETDEWITHYYTKYFLGKYC